MSHYKILLLGSTGFMGRHLLAALENVPEFTIITAGRSSTQAVSVDLAQWAISPQALELDIDLVINAAGYGVVKTETQTELMASINYLGPSVLFSSLPVNTKWLQIGTAFEYDLAEIELNEHSRCCPRTFYGISKWMVSHYLLSQQSNGNYSIIRPFAMYGPYEAESKIIPYLIRAQATKTVSALSSGQQQRDYVYVKDVTDWICRLVCGWMLNSVQPPNVINVGSGTPKSLRSIADDLSRHITHFDPQYWNWGQVTQRFGESAVFYNASELATQWGFCQREPESTFKETVNFYE